MSSMITAAVVIGGTAAYSASQKNKAADRAAQAQQQGISEAQLMSEEAAAAASKKLDPLAELTTPGLAKMNETSTQYRGLGNEGIAALKDQRQPLNVAQFLDPSAAYQLKAGQDAVQSSAAARGGLLSGATMQSLTKMGQGIASTNYNNAVSQAMQNRNQQLGIADSLQNYGTTATNINSNLLNTGVNATGQQANIIGMQGTNAANLAMTSGNVAGAQAAAQKDVFGSGLAAGLGAYFSDEDLKEIDGAVSDDDIEEFLSKMDAKSYEYTPEAKAKGAPSGKQVGILAQDAEKSKIGRNLVEKDDEGDRMMNVPKTVSALLATAATLNKRITKLEGTK